MTEWRDVARYGGRYKVSDGGLIWSTRRSLLMRLTPGRYGHLSVTLSRDGQQEHYLVHRLVLATFVGPCPDGMEGCHNDGDAGNNSVSNLRWDTPSANVRDSIGHGTHANGRKTHCGKGHAFDDVNTNVTVTKRSNGPQRNCRICNREAARASRRKRSKPKKSSHQTKLTLL